MGKGNFLNDSTKLRTADLVDNEIHLEVAHPQPQIAPSEPSTLRTVFVGADGLRAGWSLAIFIALMFALLRAATVVLRRLHFFPPGGAGAELSPGMAFVGELIPLLATVLVTWVMSKIEKRPNSVYGLGLNRNFSRIFIGLVWGVAFSSLLVFTLWKTGLLVVENRLLFGSDALRYGAEWLLAFLMVGMLEEYLFRGYFLFTLARGLAGIYAWLFKTRHSKALGFWTAAFALSILFGLGHGNNPGESPIGLLSAGLVSVVFCLSLWRTGSLWWAVGCHAAWDWAQSFLYGVADSGIMAQHHLLATHPVGKVVMSGGTTGPEGSIFVLPILALISLVVFFKLPQRSDSNAVVATGN